MVKFSIVIHGPLESDFLKLNLEKIRKITQNVCLVISTYEDSINEVQTIANEYISDIKLKIVSCKDVFNPGFYNINRQINLFTSGLRIVEDGNYVIKLRMDQSVDFDSLLKVIEPMESRRDKRILTTNCYTRKDRLYHPSDMLMAGHKDSLVNYFENIYFDDTHLDNILAIKEKVRRKEECGFSEYWPESRLFLNYLSNQQEEIENTTKHSEDMLRKYVYLVNSWDIDLRWKKFRQGTHVLLPYHFKLCPFEGGPVENAKNYAAHQIMLDRKLSVNDVFHLAYAYIYFFIFNLKGKFLFDGNEIKKTFRRLFIFSLRLMPPILHGKYISVCRRLYNAFR